MIARFKTFICAHTTKYGDGVLDHFKVSYTTQIKAWLGVLYLFRLTVLNSRKYIFETFRNRELIACLNPRDVLILGGKPDLHQCLENGYGLFRTGGIEAAILVAWRRGRTAPLILQIYLAKKLLRGRKYFFLWEDTLPVGIFFSLLGNSCHHSTICIQHGFHSAGASGAGLNDGALCKYNLLYALEQKEHIPSSDTAIFELGLPYDVASSNEISREIVLVGTGEHEYRRDFYFRSLDFYKRVQEQLRGRGWAVTYRPHPDEHGSDYSSLFPAVDEGTKLACLSGPRKTFIGYVSTLLYEARTLGHCVICVTDPAMHKNSFTPNAEIDADDARNIETVIDNLHSEMETILVPRPRPIRDRFLAILGEIEMDRRCLDE
ncbi:MAG: hypothetical protein NTW45_02770 [Rhodocyclales bacterium]|nr:hypothetical protein [Rhodocyclales bacterium]